MSSQAHCRCFVHANKQLLLRGGFRLLIHRAKGDFERLGGMAPLPPNLPTLLLLLKVILDSKESFVLVTESQSTLDSHTHTEAVNSIKYLDLNFSPTLSTYCYASC